MSRFASCVWSACAVQADDDRLSAPHEPAERPVKTLHMMHTSKHSAFASIEVICCLPLWLGCTCGFVYAQEQQAATAPALQASADYTFQINAGVWVPRLGGENGNDIVIEEDFEL